MTSSMSCPSSSLPTITSYHPFSMPTSKVSIRNTDRHLRSQIRRELTLATLKDPSSWDHSWRSLLFVAVVLRQQPLIESLQDHPFLYERWSQPDAMGSQQNMKMLFTNEEGTSLVLLGTSVQDGPDEISPAARSVHSVC
jgi:hypothetical protein